MCSRDISCVLPIHGTFMNKMVYLTGKLGTRKLFRYHGLGPVGTIRFD